MAGMPEEGLDYMAPLITVLIDVTKTKGPDTIHGPTLTIVEHNQRDEMIMSHMYGLEMLCHQNRCRVSTRE